MKSETFDLNELDMFKILKLLNFRHISNEYSKNSDYLPDSFRKFDFTSIIKNKLKSEQIKKDMKKDQVFKSYKKLNQIMDEKKKNNRSASVNIIINESFSNSLSQELNLEKRIILENRFKMLSFANRKEIKDFSSEIVSSSQKRKLSYDSVINYKEKKWYNRIFNVTVKNINLNEDKFSLFGIQNLNNSHIVNLEKYLINNEFREEEISEKQEMQSFLESQKIKLNSVLPLDKNEIKAKINNKNFKIFQIKNGKSVEFLLIVGSIFYSNNVFKNRVMNFCKRFSNAFRSLEMNEILMEKLFFIIATKCSFNKYLSGTLKDFSINQRSDNVNILKEKENNLKENNIEEELNINDSNSKKLYFHESLEKLKNGYLKNELIFDKSTESRENLNPINELLIKHEEKDLSYKYVNERATNVIKSIILPVINTGITIKRDLSIVRNNCIDNEINNKKLTFLDKRRNNKSTNIMKDIINKEREIKVKIEDEKKRQEEERKIEESKKKPKKFFKNLVKSKVDAIVEKNDKIEQKNELNDSKNSVNADLFITKNNENINHNNNSNQDFLNSIRNNQSIKVKKTTIKDKYNFNTKETLYEKLESEESINSNDSHQIVIQKIEKSIKSKSKNANLFTKHDINFELSFHFEGYSAFCEAELKTIKLTQKDYALFYICAKEYGYNSLSNILVPPEYPVNSLKYSNFLKNYRETIGKQYSQIQSNYINSSIKNNFNDKVKVIMRKSLIFGMNELEEVKNQVSEIDSRRSLINLKIENQAENLIKSNLIHKRKTVKNNKIVNINNHSFLAFLTKITPLKQEYDDLTDLKEYNWINLRLLQNLKDPTCLLIKDSNKKIFFREDSYMTDISLNIIEESISDLVDLERQYKLKRLMQTDLFRKLGDNFVERYILSKIKTRYVKCGENVISQGNYLNSLFFVIEGNFQVSVKASLKRVLEMIFELLKDLKFKEKINESKEEILKFIIEEELKAKMIHMLKLKQQSKDKKGSPKLKSVNKLIKDKETNKDKNIEKNKDKPKVKAKFNVSSKIVDLDQQRLNKEIEEFKKFVSDQKLNEKKETINKAFGDILPVFNKNKNNNEKEEEVEDESVKFIFNNKNYANLDQELRYGSVDNVMKKLYLVSPDLYEYYHKELSIEISKIEKNDVIGLNLVSQTNIKKKDDKTSNTKNLNLKDISEINALGHHVENIRVLEFNNSLLSKFYSKDSISNFTYKCTSLNGGILYELTREDIESIPSAGIYFIIKSLINEKEESFSVKVLNKLLSFKISTNQNMKLKYPHYFSYDKIEKDKSLSVLMDKNYFSEISKQISKYYNEMVKEKEKQLEIEKEIEKSDFVLENPLLNYSYKDKEEIEIQRNILNEYYQIKKKKEESIYYRIASQLIEEEKKYKKLLLEEKLKLAE